MNVKLIPIAIAAALLVAGCQESASDTREDVAEARTEAREDSNEVRQEAAEDARDANRDVARTGQPAGQPYGQGMDPTRAGQNDAQEEAVRVQAKSAYDIAITDADGRHEVEKEKCDALTGNEQDACVSAADAAHSAAKATAEANRDATLASVDRPN